MTLSLMTRAKKLHTAPNQSIQNDLISLAESAGYSSKDLRNFLWLINAHDRLIAFPKISQNVLNMLEVAEASWGFSEKDFQLDGIKSILRWIVNNADKLTSLLGEDFNKRPKTKLDHPIMHQGSSRHPFYTTLWNTCESKEYSERYLLLQAHLLFAHTNALFASNNQIDFENYAGQTEWKGLENSPYAASLAVRDLSLNKNSGLLHQIQVHQPPEEFAKSITRNIKIDQREMLMRMQALERFIQKSVGLRKWRTNHGSSGNGRGGSPHVKGFVEFAAGRTFRNIEVGDKDDLDTNWIEQTLVLEVELNQQDVSEVLDLDLCPLEFDSEELYLSGVNNSNTLSGSVSSITVSQMRHIVMANQLLPWSFNNLTIQELAKALVITNQWAKEIGSKPNPTEEDCSKFEAITLMRIMLFTASTFERARQTIILNEDQQNIDAPLALIETRDNGPLWRIRAIQPAYKTLRKASDNSEKVRSDYFFVEERSITNKYISNIVRLRGDVDTTKRSYQVFRGQSDTLLRNLKKLLTDIDPSGRLTINKISKFLFNHLINETHGDICAASMISGDEHFLAHVRLFYSVISISKLQQQYLGTINKIVSQLYLASNKTFNLRDFAQEKDQTKFVGSRLCPTLASVKTAINKLHVDVESAFNAKNTILFHNLYTLLTAWRFSFATACRAISTPYVSLSEIDMDTGLGVLSDKDDGTGYKSRLIWLPKNILTEMSKYESHRLKLESFSIEELFNSPPIFFIEHGLKNQSKIINVRPKTLMPMMEQYLQYPANFHRRFMRSELIERGCPIEVVDSWMGHWHAGEEPWSTHSTFSFHLYQEALEKYLIPILNEIGLVCEKSHRN